MLVITALTSNWNMLKYAGALEKKKDMNPGQLWLFQIPRVFQTSENMWNEPSL